MSSLNPELLNYMKYDYIVHSAFFFHGCMRGGDQYLVSHCMINHDGVITHKLSLYLGKLLRAS